MLRCGINWERWNTIEAADACHTTNLSPEAILWLLTPELLYCKTDSVHDSRQIKINDSQVGFFEATCRCRPIGRPNSLTHTSL